MLHILLPISIQDYRANTEKPKNTIYPYMQHFRTAPIFIQNIKLIKAYTYIHSTERKKYKGTSLVKLL